MKNKIELIHGDCIKKMRDIENNSIDLVLTDPPYGITACKWDSAIPFEPMWEALKRITKDNGAIVLMASQPFTTELIYSNKSMFKYCWYWEKSRPSGFLQAKRQPMKSVEEIVVFYKKCPTYNPQGAYKAFIQNKTSNNPIAMYRFKNKKYKLFEHKTINYPRTLIRAKNIEQILIDKHPTQKPLELMKYLIKTYTNENDTVLDFTMGSGTTGLAARILKRDFIGIELDEKYYKISEQRILRDYMQPELGI